MEEDIVKLRTLKQNASIHQWFKDVAKECLDTGATINDIIAPAMDMQVDEHFIKYLFRRIGTKKYGKSSTADLEVHEINLIYDEMVKFFAEKVDPPVVLPPFPSQDNVIMK